MYIFCLVLCYYLIFVTFVVLTGITVAFTLPVDVDVILDNDQPTTAFVVKADIASTVDVCMCERT